jgi:capsular polysaccharide transport system permease protein
MNIEAIDHETLQEVVRKSERQSLLVKHRWFALFVGLPTLLAIIYYGFIASPIYVSESKFIIKAPGEKGVPSLSLASLIQSSGSSSGKEQTQEVLEYVRSRNALRDVENTIGFRSRYSDRGADILTKFPQPFQDGSFENLYRYYSDTVSANMDQESGLATIEVQALTPQDAYKINGKLLDLSEQFVNRLNARAETRAIAEAEERVATAEARVANARVALSAYQNQQDLIDPAKQATGVLDVSNKLTADQAALGAQLELMRRVAPRNPAIPALRSRIIAIQRQIAAQTGRAVGTPTGIASKLASYEKLSAEQEFATQMLTAADAALEQARAEAQKQQFYLERVVEPGLPDAPTLPHRLKKILVMFASAISLYFVGWMVVVGILEHAPED